MVVLYIFETVRFYFKYKIEKEVVRQESKNLFGVMNFPPTLPNLPKN